MTMLEKNRNHAQHGSQDAAPASSRLGTWLRGRLSAYVASNEAVFGAVAPTRSARPVVEHRTTATATRERPGQR